jgi:uncharacterized membrane protein (DUF106 family)
MINFILTAALFSLVLILVKENASRREEIEVTQEMVESLIVKIKKLEEKTNDQT